MIPNSVSSEQRIVFLAVPHPASRRALAFLRSVLAACPERIGCALATSPDQADDADGIFVYLRPGAAAVLDLAHAADRGLTAQADAAYVLVGRLDHRWRHSNVISLEHLLARPDQVLRTLSRLIGTPFPNSVYAAADENISTLRDDVARYSHPLAFLAAVEARSTATADGEATPRWLVITGDDAFPVELPGAPAGVEGRMITEMPLDESLGERLQAMRELPTVVHFHHILGVRFELPLLDWVLPQLAAGGRLSGSESSEAAAEQVMSRLTRTNGRRGFVFTLEGRDWRAIPFVEHG